MSLPKTVVFQGKTYNCHYTLQQREVSADDIRAAIERGAPGVHRDVFCSASLAEAVGEGCPRYNEYGAILGSLGYSQLPHVMSWNGKTRRVWVAPGTIIDRRNLRKLLNETL